MLPVPQADTPLHQLLEIVRALRGPDGCPWDKVQTLDSLTPYIIEEAYELTEAMQTANWALLKEELGDVLLHVAMLSNMAEEAGQFKFQDVAQEVAQKMIRRHPHVFGNTTVANAEDVVTNWEKIKSKEKPTTETTSVMDSIPTHLPALMQCHKLSKRAAKLGFDWPDSPTGIDQMISKILEEIEEMKEAAEKHPATENGPHPDTVTEFGDILFALVQLARRFQVNPEHALRTSNQKFMKRFAFMEKAAKLQEKAIENLSLEEWETLWRLAKTEN